MGCGSSMQKGYIGVPPEEHEGDCQRMEVKVNSNGPFSSFKFALVIAEAGEVLIYDSHQDRIDKNHSMNISLKTASVKKAPPSTVRTTDADGIEAEFRLNNSIDQGLFYADVLESQKEIFCFSQEAENPLESFQMLSGNSICADCYANDPEWFCFYGNSLTCIKCAGIHRGMNEHRVKSVSLDFWTEKEVEIASRSPGNSELNDKSDYGRYDEEDKSDNIDTELPSLGLKAFIEKKYTLL